MEGHLERTRAEKKRVRKCNHANVEGDHHIRLTLACPRESTVQMGSIRQRNLSGFKNSLTIVNFCLLKLVARSYVIK